MLINPENIWSIAKKIKIEIGEGIYKNFNIGFDKQISKDIQDKLCSFIVWVEQNFNLPVTLWVDFEYKHYLVARDGKRVGFLFYWSDFSEYPRFKNSEDIPHISLPVRTEHSTMEEILTSFIEAITYYFAWICNILDNEFQPDENDVEEILQAYLNFKNKEEDKNEKIPCD